MTAVIVQQETLGELSTQKEVCNSGVLSNACAHWLALDVALFR